MFTLFVVFFSNNVYADVPVPDEFVNHYKLVVQKYNVLTVQ